MKVFYHSADLDGHCSGKLIDFFRMPPKDKNGDSPFSRCIRDELRDDSSNEFTLIPINYGDQFPWHILNKHDLVYMLDFSLPRKTNSEQKDLTDLNDFCRLRWIDHHKTAIDEYADVANEIKGLRSINLAACELVWEYMAGLAKTPLPVELLGRYDVWDLGYSEIVLPFQMGMRNRITNPVDFESHQTWCDLFLDPLAVYPIIVDGLAILNYQKQECKKYFNERSFITEIGDIPAYAINGGMTNSMVFGDKLKTMSLGIVFWRRPDRRWNVHLYSETIDVSEIAKKYGGGGHKGAAGFLCEELPFEI